MLPTVRIFGANSNLCSDHQNLVKKINHEANLRTQIVNERCWRFSSGLEITRWLL